MKKKIITVIIGIFLIVSMMFAEYRFIMNNIRPYLGERNTVYLEMFGYIDTYYADYAENIEN